MTESSELLVAPGPRRRLNRSLVVMYLPLALLLLVQGTLVAVAPSSRSAADSTSFVSGSTSPVGPVDGAADSTDIALPSGTPRDGSPSDEQTGTGSNTPGAGATSTTPSGGSAGGGRFTDDRSHCSADGRQHDVVYYAPPCVPRWEGPSTGPTHPNIRDDGTVLGVVMLPEINPALQAIQGPDQRNSTAENAREYAEVVEEFLNTRFEFYGRRLDIEVYDSNCPLTPDDPPACNQAAQEVAAMRPVLAGYPIDHHPEMFDTWTRAGIMSNGGFALPDDLYNDRRPFRWTPFSTVGDVTAAGTNFICRQMAGRKATHSGQVIHSSIGARGAVDRKFGIITGQAREYFAQALRDRLLACGVPDSKILVIVASGDVNQAAQEVRLVTAKMIEEKVTTVIWANNQFGAALLTPEMSRNNYFPENVVISGTLLDTDANGQLPDQRQWAHAFGAVTSTPSVPYEESQTSVVWQEMGNSGEACGGFCDAVWVFANQWAHMIQTAGPDLTPENVEAGMFAMGPRGGWAETQDPSLSLSVYGPSDYASQSDFRIVYWDPTTPSPANNRPGTYLVVDGGRRYAFDEALAPELQFPPAPQ